MQKRHCPRLNMSCHPRSDCHVRIRVQGPLVEASGVRVKIRIVTICKHDVIPMCRIDASSQGSTIAALGYRHYTTSKASGDFTGTISAAIVGDNYFIIDIFLIQSLPHLAHASFDRFFLIKAWEDETQSRAAFSGCGYHRLLYVKQRALESKCYMPPHACCPEAAYGSKSLKRWRCACR